MSSFPQRTSLVPPLRVAQVALGVRSTPLVDHWLVCPLVPEHQGSTITRSMIKNCQLVCLKFVSAPVDIVVQPTDVNSSIGSPGSPPLVLNLA